MDTTPAARPIRRPSQDRIDQSRIDQIEYELSSPFATDADRRHWLAERDFIESTRCCGWCRYWIRLTEMSDRRIFEITGNERPVAPGRCGHPARGGGSIVVEYDPPTTALPSDPGFTNRSSCELRRRF